MRPPRVTASRIAYENPWTRVREDALAFEDGRAGLYGVVEKPDFAVVLPIHADGRIEVVSQWRHPVGARVWELPQGAPPPGTTAAPDVLAANELAEETGLRAGRMAHLGRLLAMAGLSGQHYDAFAAFDLTRKETSREATEADMETEAVTPGTLAAMIADGRMRDGHSLAVLALAAMRGLIALPPLR